MKLSHEMLYIYAIQFESETYILFSLVSYSHLLKICEAKNNETSKITSDG